MSLDNITAGYGSVSEYLVPGIPWVYTDTITGSVRYDFPAVTKKLIVKNAGGAAVSVAFTNAGLTGKNNFLLNQNESIELDARVKSIYLTSTNCAVSVYAALTGIRASMCPLITGSFGDGTVLSGVG
jgi:hypothetical protein